MKKGKNSVLFGKAHGAAYQTKRGGMMNQSVVSSRSVPCVLQDWVLAEPQNSLEKIAPQSGARFPTFACKFERGQEFIDCQPAQWAEVFEPSVAQLERLAACHSFQ